MVKSLRGLQRWLVIQALLWLALLVAVAWRVAGVEQLAAAIGGVLLVSMLSLWSVLGVGRRIADGVTLARFLALLALGAVIVLRCEIDWLSWSCLLAVVLSDLFDGWCARRFGGSREGAMLDMETDQFVTMSLALFGFWYAGIGAWILLLPAYKYAYVLFLILLGRPAHDPKPRPTGNLRGRLICALVMALLLICLVPLASQPVRLVASLCAVLALAYSFGCDAVYLRRAGNDAPIG